MEELASIGKLALYLGALNLLLTGIRKGLLRIKDSTTSSLDDKAVVYLDKALWVLDALGFNPDHEAARIMNAKKRMGQ